MEDVSPKEFKHTSRSQKLILKLEMNAKAKFKEKERIANEKRLKLSGEQAQCLLVDITGGSVMSKQHPQAITSPNKKSEMEDEHEIKVSLSPRPTNNATRHKDIIECFTPFTIVHLRGSILNGLTFPFDSYKNIGVRVVTCTSEDENSIGFRGNSNLIYAKLEAQQLYLLGNASALADEVIPLYVSKVLGQQTEKTRRHMQNNSNKAACISPCKTT